MQGMSIFMACLGLIAIASFSQINTRFHLNSKKRTPLPSILPSIGGPWTYTPLPIRVFPEPLPIPSSDYPIHGWPCTPGQIS